MVLACHHISKSFGTDVIINDATFLIEEKEKAAIVGINGAGKTTLLEIIVGSLSADEGEVVFGKDKTFGYLSQHQNLDSGATIYEEVFGANAKLLDMERRLRGYEEQMKTAQGIELEALIEAYTKLTHSFELINGYAYKSEVVGVLKGLGFEEAEFDKHCNELSGGLKTRVALAKLLLLKPDLIILDEPTNHLDISSVKWLEDYLRQYPGSVLIVAHDRYFLDRIASKIIEIDNAAVSVFSGNYSDYAIKKEALREAALNAYLNQQAFIKHQEEVIEKLHSFNREKSVKRARSREKLLENLDRIEKPTEIKSDMSLSFSTGGVRSGDDVLHIEALTKAYDVHTLFENVNLDIRRGERVAIIGDNGTGKTTLLKIINGLASADTGSFSLGANVTVGYYDQEQQLLDDSKTVFDEIQDSYPTLNNTEVRNTLALFLFTGDDVFKSVSALSGGERGRLSLAKLILSPCNLLILDEPTNHLDIVSKEVLEKSLLKYEGTLMFVSHDRYFVNKLSSRVLELDNKQFISYGGNYDYYLEKKAQLSTGGASGDITQNVSMSHEAPSDNKLSYQARKEEAARLRKLASDKEKIEKEIEVLEKRNAEIDELLTHEDIFTNSGKCLELQTEQNDNKIKIEELFEKWSELEGD